MKTVLLTGGTGLVGKALTQKLILKGYKVIILTRNKKLKNTDTINYAFWDVEKALIDKQAVAEADYIIHLAGANVAEKRWTDKRKKEIENSRTKSGALLCNALKETNHKIKKLISASAIGWYGADAEIPNPYPFEEDANYSNDFLGQTCYRWEQSLQPLKNENIALVILRTGIVLSNNGGALKEFMKPIKLGFAAVLGTGRQMISWIHIDDLVELYIEAMEDDLYSGVYNAVAPEPVSNATLVKELAKKMKGKLHITYNIPESILKVMLGEMSVEVLKSATVSCKKVQDAGFVFAHPTINSALQQLIKKS